MAEKSPYLNVSDLTGGINSADSPFSIEPNQVTEAFNVDFRAGKIGTKRNGIEAVPLTGSILAFARPRLATTDTGGFVAAAGSIAVSAYANTTDATGNTYHFLAVTIGTKAGSAASAVTLGAAPLTLFNASVAGGLRVEQWYLKTPSLAGGTLSVTLGAAVNCSIIAQRWTEVDNSSSPQLAVGASSVLFNPNIAVGVAINYSGYVVLAGIVFDPTFVISAASNTFGTIDTRTNTSGTARLQTAAATGINPTNNFAWTMQIGATQSVMALMSILGRNDNTLSLLGKTSTVVALIRNTPTNDPTQDELWAIDSFGRIDHYRSGTWFQTPLSVNANIGPFLTASYHTNGVSLHGKLFIALVGGTGQADRMLLWDGTILRWAGISPSPIAVTAADSGGAGGFTTTRYYRVRWVEQTAGVTIRRSEPSPVFTFVPSGINASATVSRPALPTYEAGTLEGQTHWELEASIDNVLFYVIATPTLATATFIDTHIFAATSTYNSFPLSENIGEYVVPTAPRHVAVDGDRLMLGGSIFSPLNDSRVSWTPLRADTGVANDERIPITNRFFQDLDGLNGGNLTHLIPGMMGGMYGFKLSRIYKFVRTGAATRAYDVQFESSSRGAFMRAGRLSSGVNGAPIIYFVDPNVGLCAFSDQGVEDLMQTRRDIALRMNNLPSVLNARVVVYSRRWLVWVWLALDNAVVPNYALAYNLRTRGWTDISGHFADVVAAVPCFTNTGETPYIALSNPRTSYICEADSTTSDDGLPFRAWITTKPMQLGQLYRKFGIQAIVLHCKAAASTIGIALIRNLGLERKDVSTSIAPTASETYVVRPIDDARMSECQFVQFELGDPVTFSGAQLLQTWTLDELAAKMRSEDESTS